MSKDDLGDRMKMYERVESDRRFMPLVPIIARIDGRGFSKFTKGMARPFDEKMSQAMINTTRRLVEDTHALMGYTQSDEITLVWHSEDLNSQVWFDGRVLKMNTGLAASATLFFYQEVMKTMPEYARRNPRFDARANSMPNRMEAANNFLWRERDASKNSVSMAARAHYSHNQVDRKNGSEMQDMLMEKGINWNNYPAFFKRGTFIQRRVIEGPFSAEELASLPERHHARSNPDLTVTRSRIIELDMPVFDKVTNRVDVIFNGADPQTNGKPTT
jgi:tRNA(His) 5'-end guanylyltransferase